MTPERVDITTRLKAVLIDGMMALLPGMLAVMVGLFFTDMGDLQRARQVSSTMLGLLPVWVLAYFATEAVFGRTLGKKLVGIVVRAADGGRASPGALLLRWAAKFVWLLIGPLLRTVGKLGPEVSDPISYVTLLIALIGFGWAARAARQALWDKVAGTAVFRR